MAEALDELGGRGGCSLGAQQRRARTAGAKQGTKRHAKLEASARQKARDVTVEI